MRRSRARSRKNGGSFESLLADTTVRVPVRCSAYVIAGANGETGMVSGSDLVRVSPGLATQFGSTRLGVLANCFDLYRMHSWTIRYYPVTTGSGVEDTNGTAVSTPAYNATTFAFGADVRDPEEITISSPTIVQLVEKGARMFHTDRPFVYKVNIRNPRWLYTFVDNSTPADRRQTCWGQMFAVSPSEQTDNNTFGFLVHDLVVEFKGPSTPELTPPLSARPRPPALRGLDREVDEKSDVSDAVKIDPVDATLLRQVGKDPGKPRVGAPGGTLKPGARRPQ